jgi:ABC-2 type transport system permease protein
VNVTVYYFIWRAIYRNGGAIQGFNFEQMVTYVAVGWIIRTFYYNNIDREMANDVQQGHIAAKLARPVNYQGMQISQAIGESVFRMIMFTIPTGAVILLIYRCSSHLLLLLCFSSPLLFLCHHPSINFIIGTCAVYLQSILGLIRAKYFLIEILSGLVIPISFFPDPLVRLSQWLPFQHISYTPLMIYMGKISGKPLALVLLVESFWAVALVFAGHWFWIQATRKLTVQGG